MSLEEEEQKEERSQIIFFWVIVAFKREIWREKGMISKIEESMAGISQSNA